MNELSFEVQTNLGTLTANFDEIKDALALQMTAYADLEVVEDNIAERKKDLATLRKIRKAIDDRRKEVKKEFARPYNAFEEKVYDLIKVVDEPIELIDVQLRQFEQKRVAEKKLHVAELFAQTIGEYAEYFPEDFIKSEWLNKTTTDKQIIDDIQVQIIKIQNDLSAIKGLTSPIEGELISLYKSTHDLAVVMRRAGDYNRDAEMIKQKHPLDEVIDEVVEEVVEELIPEEKTELKTITVKAADYDRAVNVLTFNDIEIF